MRPGILKPLMIACMCAAVAACSMHPNEKPPPKKKGVEIKTKGPGPSTGPAARRGKTPLGARPGYAKPTGEDLRALTKDLKVAGLPEGDVVYVVYAGGIRGEIEPCG